MGTEGKVSDPKPPAVMRRFDLQQSYDEELDVRLKPGMGWAIYTDHGPSGVCGQSMSATCPHAVFAVFPDEETLRDAIEKQFRRGAKSNIQYGVIGDWSTGNGAVTVMSR